MKDFIRFLRRFARPYTGTLTLSIIFNMLNGVMTVFSFAFIIPILQVIFGLQRGEYHFKPWDSPDLMDTVTNNFYYFTGYIINSKGESQALAYLGAIFIIMTFVKVMTGYLSEYFTIPMRNGVVRDIRNTMYAKILSLPIGYFNGEKKGDIMARMSGDVTEVEASVMSSLYALFRYPILIIIYLATMIAVSWRLTLFVFVLLPIMGWVMGTVGKKLKAQGLRTMQIGGQILSTIEESLGGLRIIKAFNAEKQMDTRFRSETQSYVKSANAMLRRQALAHPMSEFLGTIAVIVVLWFGGTLILSGSSTIDAASFIFYMTIFYSIINPAKDLSKTGYAVSKGMAALARIDKILDAENPIKDPANPEIIPQDMPQDTAAIEFKDVSFKYDDGENMVLNNINLRVPKGHTVAIVGQSGSGKSTLVDLIPRFYDVTKGSVKVKGHDVREVKVVDLRGLMGNVNQEAILFNDTFRNNIAFGNENATMEEVERAAKIANAHDFIMATPDGYDTLLGDRGCRLSGGERQRISIARSILKNPDILILDEATSALDNESERLVQEALDRLMADRTTIVIAHRLSTIVNADMICVMKDGKIIETGSHAQLLALDGQYARLHALSS
ncbi:MAG: ABC transporter ATP-binding protein/permease [Muribaculaceae bacterium]|nr:ABC transporter ATP-binding protein/permease [Muribaculaceae bacterium]